ncbi:MAG: VOC family protein [Hyphomicrobiales bacterium]|nr:VOC family protein [Hyphomicrobiales bacterium]MCP4998089.1 VOC family protein [Hyphomicrobiales bacterium]
MAKSQPLRAQPLIAVRDVLASSVWYCCLLGLQALGHTDETTHGSVYNRLSRGGNLILQLHSWDDENHPNLVDADRAPVGHDVLLWFELDDFNAAIDQARALGAEVVLEPHVNRGPDHREMWLRDPDGYLVVIAIPDGEAGTR